MNDIEIILVSIAMILGGFLIGWLCREEKAQNELNGLRDFYNNWLLKNRGRINDK